LEKKLKILRIKNLNIGSGQIIFSNSKNKTELFLFTGTSRISKKGLE
jgi:hypothetical protein